MIAERRTQLSSSTVDELLFLHGRTGDAMR